MLSWQNFHPWGVTVQGFNRVCLIGLQIRPNLKDLWRDRACLTPNIFLTQVLLAFTTIWPLHRYQNIYPNGSRGLVHLPNHLHNQKIMWGTWRGVPAQAPHARGGIKGWVTSLITSFRVWLQAKTRKFHKSFKALPCSCYTKKVL